MNNLGKALIIVNPVAQSGKGLKAGEYVYKTLNDYKQNVEISLTERENHAEEIAAEAKEYDTIVTVGGDGLVHEVVNGLMHNENRPALGVIPVGSGNDFAKSLNIKAKAKVAVEQLMNECELSLTDIGKVNDKYFAETLSFGVDAGIAIGTMELRKKTGQKGLILYFESGINQIAHHFNSFNVEAKLDDGSVIKENCYILAIQNGRTYGGGFPITPDAKLNDGILNICHTVGHMSRKKAMWVFALASKGLHVNRKCMSFAKSSTIKLTIDREVPCQMDGERYVNTDFDISVVPHAIQVYRSLHSLCY